MAGGEDRPVPDDDSRAPLRAEWESLQREAMLPPAPKLSPEERHVLMLPPVAAMAALALGVILALAVLPKGIQARSSNWGEYRDALQALTVPEEARSLQRWHNWVHPIWVLPFVAAVAYLGLRRPRHRLGLAGIAFGGLALVEALGLAVYYDGEDARQREAVAAALQARRDEAAERKRKAEELARQRQEEAQRKEEEAQAAAVAAAERRAQAAAEEARRAEEAARARARAEEERRRVEREEQEKKRIEAEEERKRKEELAAKEREERERRIREEAEKKQQQELAAIEARSVALKAQRQQRLEERGRIQAEQEGLKEKVGKLKGEAAELSAQKAAALKAMELAQNTIDFAKERRKDLEANNPKPQQRKMDAFLRASQRIRDDEENAAERKREAQKKLQEILAEAKAKQTEQDRIQGAIEKLEATAAEKDKAIEALDAEIQKIGLKKNVP